MENDNVGVDWEHLEDRLCRIALGIFSKRCSDRYELWLNCCDIMQERSKRMSILIDITKMFTGSLYLHFCLNLKKAYFQCAIAAIENVCKTIVESKLRRLTGSFRFGGFDAGKERSNVRTEETATESSVFLPARGNGSEDRQDDLGFGFREYANLTSEEIENLKLIHKSFDVIFFLFCNFYKNTNSSTTATVPTVKEKAKNPFSYARRWLRVRKEKFFSERQRTKGDSSEEGVDEASYGLLATKDFIETYDSYVVNTLNRYFCSCVCKLELVLLGDLDSDLTACERHVGKEREKSVERTVKEACLKYPLNVLNKFTDSMIRASIDERTKRRNLTDIILCGLKEKLNCKGSEFTIPTDMQRNFKSLSDAMPGTHVHPLLNGLKSEILSATENRNSPASVRNEMEISPCAHVTSRDASVLSESLRPEIRHSARESTKDFPFDDDDYRRDTCFQGFCEDYVLNESDVLYLKECWDAFAGYFENAFFDIFRCGSVSHARLAFRTEEEFSDGYGSDETIGGGDDDDDGKINER